MHLRDRIAAAARGDHLAVVNSIARPMPTSDFREAQAGLARIKSDGP
jgi:hypothetical protein